MMDATKRDLTQGLRIVWALAIKDILDGLKNKTVLANILIVFCLMALYQWLFFPLMYRDADLVVYDAGNSRLVDALESSPQFNLRRVNSLQELKEEMGSEPAEGLALAIPADFDERLASDGSSAAGDAVLSGYVMWSSRSSTAALQADFEARLTDLLGQAVRIDIAGTIHSRPDSMGPMRFVSMILVVTIVFMGALTVPHLMFEEKRAKTLDALLVSPAGIGQVVVGKALAGLFYCLGAVVMVFAFNWAFVTHWGLALVALLCGLLLAVGFGLLLGTFLERREQMTLWALIPGQLLLGPVFLSVVDPILTETVRNIFSWIPTVALALLFRYSFSNGAAVQEIATRLAIVAASVGLVLAAIVWKIRRSDRQ